MRNKIVVIYVTVMDLFSLFFEDTVITKHM